MGTGWTVQAYIERQFDRHAHAPQALHHHSPRAFSLSFCNLPYHIELKTDSIMSRASQVSTDEEEVPDLVPAAFLEAEATDCLRTMTFVSKRMATTKSKLGLSRSSRAELTAVERPDDEESADTHTMTQTSKASDVDSKCPTNQIPVNIEEIYSDNKWLSSAQIRSTVWLPISQVCGECKERLDAKDSHWSNVEFPEVWPHGMIALHVGCVDLTGLTVEYRWYTGLLETLKNSLQFGRIPADLPSSEGQGEELGGALTNNANEVWAYRLAEHIQELGLLHAAKTICTITRDIIDSPAQLGSTTPDQAFGPIWTFWRAVREVREEPCLCV